jgi:hypothetical protein
VFEISLLRRIFGPKWEEVAGGWEKLEVHKFQLLLTNHVYYNKIKDRKLAGTWSMRLWNDKCTWNFSQKTRMDEATSQMSSCSYQ